MTTTEASPLAIEDSPRRAPWGRWGVRTLALTYLTVMLIIPLAVILQDGLREGVVGLWQAISLPIAWSAGRGGGPIIISST